MVHIDPEGNKYNIGYIKIGKIGLEEGRANIPTEFKKLDNKKFFQFVIVKHII